MSVDGVLAENSASCHTSGRASLRDMSSPDIIRVPLSESRISNAKSAYTTRRVSFGIAKHILTGGIRPRAGDLVLARIARIGQHARIELPSGRRARLNVGDEVIVAYGARYAPDQFESYVPDDLGPCHLVAAGGVASLCVTQNSKMKKPTRIEPVGLLARENGNPINLGEWAVEHRPISNNRPNVYVVVGTMMNAGKTTFAANLVHGLKNEGLRVGAAKVTGTGSGGDRWMLSDYGADIVLDITDAGVPSTFGLPITQIEDIFVNLTNRLAAEYCEAIVVEIADGICQRETAELIKSDVFKTYCGKLFFAAGDALGALAGVQFLNEIGHSVAAVGGALTASDLTIEEAKRLLDVPVVTSEDLFSGNWMPIGIPAVQQQVADIITIERVAPDISQAQA